MKGSLLAKVEKPVSWPFECLGGRSEFVSFVLAVDGVAAAASDARASPPASSLQASSSRRAPWVVAAGVADFFPAEVMRHFPGEQDREQDCTADGELLGAPVLRLPDVLHSLSCGS